MRTFYWAIYKLPPRASYLIQYQWDKATLIKLQSLSLVVSYQSRKSRGFSMILSLLPCISDFAILVASIVNYVCCLDVSLAHYLPLLDIDTKGKDGGDCTVFDKGVNMPFFCFF